MDANATKSLAKFCAEQQDAFDLDAWAARFESDGIAVALVAKYLAMTSWYGHEEALDGFASTRCRFASGSGHYIFFESQAVDFDLPYFAAKLRLTLSQHHQAQTFRSPGAAADPSPV